MEADGWKKLRIWGMGIAAADVNQDGDQDYYLTSMADQKLQVLKDTASGKLDFADIAYKRGVTAHIPYTGGDTRPSTGWHSQCADVNNDGRADLFVAKGNVAKMADFAEKDPNNLLLADADGMFLEVGDKAGVDSMNIGRGTQVVDLNLDRLPDIVVVNRWVPAEVWRQTGTPGGNGVEVRLQQEGTSRDAIGSVIEIRRGDKIERHEVSAGGGHLSGSVGWLHFGLDGAQTAELRVIWPNGSGTTDWQTLPAATIQIPRPEAPAEVWTPR